MKNSQRQQTEHEQHKGYAHHRGCNTRLVPPLVIFFFYMPSRHEDTNNSETDLPENFLTLQPERLQNQHTEPLMEYNFNEIEKKWQQYWREHKTFKAFNNSEKPKYYVLDMFPYPSGAGLHVGHPLGYIASDIYTRYKRLQGFNVLHPMGFDAYGLPAEQYAIQTGTHPAETTEKNIVRYREQLDQIGFSFDWDREVVTSDPFYYKWTQWTFIRLFTALVQQGDKPGGAG